MYNMFHIIFISYFLCCLLAMVFLLLIVLSPDSDKNKLAMDVIRHLIADCGWLNVHIVPPHGVVFEIRVADGYGARWSKDGSEVSV